MDSSIAERLIEINREFYTRFGESFSATRQRIQPGVRRVLGMLQGHEAILDLGCGNGELARALAERGHRGPYLGVDFSLPLLRAAGSQPEGFATNFMQADLTRPREIAELSLVNDNWDAVTAFAVLHHIPSMDLRLDLLRVVRRLLKTDGMFVHSNWQFLNSERLKARTQPWEAVSLAGSDVEMGDYLLDWRSGGRGLRYVHHFTGQELADYAGATGFNVVDTFYSDGERGRLGLYQVWRPAE
jgi:SAM-dependent methyltransferase